MKLVLITGASSGVGAATARVFAGNGNRVVLVARSESLIDALASEIGENAIAAPCDAADPDAVAAMAKQIQDNHGVPDVVINCAGAGQWKTLQDTTSTEAVTMMQAPYFAAFFVTKAFLPGMLDRKSGIVIHVNSPACIAPWPSSVGYTASRAALCGFHEALSQDLAKTGVQSCHVIFGKISSAYFDNNPGVAEKIPAISKTIPTLSPEKCAEILVELARRPRYSRIFPLMLRLQLGFAAFFPGITRWLLRM